jgi:rRNA maturation RNase YbeY
VPLHDELARLIVHGLLHIKGFDDRTEPERKEMTIMENTLLNRNWKY